MKGKDNGIRKMEWLELFEHETNRHVLHAFDGFKSRVKGCNEDLSVDGQLCELDWEMIE